MAKWISDLNLGLDEDLKEKLQWLFPDHSDYRILKKSIDARKKRDIRFIYQLEVSNQGEKLEVPRIELPRVVQPPKLPPIVVGAGPAGLFAALRFVERGVPCHLIERGSRAEERIKGINRFWRYGELDPKNNVCFGEGGAGLYSDGKLITRIKSPHIPYVLQRLTDFGAPEEIQYLANPHVGSDKIRRLIPKIRQYLLEHGCVISFDTEVTSLLTQGDCVTGVKTSSGQQIEGSCVILATGHSATSTLHALHEQGVYMQGKSFAMGLRIEHAQSFINKSQYGAAHDHPQLKAANYRLADHNHQLGVGVYSFCMCPGGFVLSAGTESDGVVCNGMSNFNRGSDFANAAIVMSIDTEKWFGTELWGGMQLRRELELKAYQSVRAQGGHKQLPIQNVADFLSRKATQNVLPISSPSGAIAVRLDEMLPSSLWNHLSESLQKFDRLIPGFASHEAQLYGIESRTSCPVRVTRDEQSFQSLSHKNLYPCGEGAGYAGGITSAACDGIKIVDRIIEEWS